MIASHIDTVTTGEWVEDRVVVRIRMPGILLPDHEFDAGEKAPRGDEGWRTGDGKLGSTHVVGDLRGRPSGRGHAHREGLGGTLIVIPRVLSRLVLSSLDK